MPFQRQRFEGITPIVNPQVRTAIEQHDRSGGLTHPPIEQLQPLVRGNGEAAHRKGRPRFIWAGMFSWHSLGGSLAQIGRMLSAKDTLCLGFVRVGLAGARSRFAQRAHWLAGTDTRSTLRNWHMAGVRELNGRVRLVSLPLAYRGDTQSCSAHKAAYSLLRPYTPWTGGGDSWMRLTLVATGRSEV